MSLPLRGQTTVPGDKSMGHRALLLGALTDGVVHIRGLGSGHDNLCTQAALRALGVSVERDGTSARVHGVGLRGLQAPVAPIDCGNSGTTMRLLLGILAGQDFEVMLVGDESLSGRPMARVLDPLERMGLTVLETGEGRRAPIRIRGSRKLRGIDYASPIASAQVKSAVLLAGLWAQGETSVSEPHPSRDHTERMLEWLGRPPRARDIEVPGDLSSASFLVAAALMVPGSRIEISGVGTNPTRTGFLDVLEAMGAQVELRDPQERNLEPSATLAVSHRPLSATHIEGALTVRAIDELPLVATLASQARGVTTIRDASELRHKESDRIARVAEMLRSFGIPVDEHPDGLDIHGDPDRSLRPGRVNARGDHRIAMCGTLLSRIAPPGTRIEGAETIASSFPEFHSKLGDLEA